jgi:hypothetical protein
VKAKDIKLGMRVKFENERTVWTVARSRRTKKGIVFGLVMEGSTFKGTATTHPLADDREIEVVLP